MTTETQTPVRSRRKLWLSLIVVGLTLLTPAIVVPTALYFLEEPAFKSFDEVSLDQIRSLELFILNRPDQLEDIGSTKTLQLLPASSHEQMLTYLKEAKPVDSKRSIFLGRLLVELKNGRREQVILNRFGDRTKGYTVRFFIAQQGFDAGPVNDFTRMLDEFLGRKAEAKPKE